MSAGFDPQQRAELRAHAIATALRDLLDAYLVGDVGYDVAPWVLCQELERFARLATVSAFLEELDLDTRQHGVLGDLAGVVARGWAA